MARRKRRASRHQRGLETVPEKLLVKIVEARLAGKPPRRVVDLETSSFPWRNFSFVPSSFPWRNFGFVPQYDQATQDALNEIICTPPPVGTSGKFVRQGFTYNDVRKQLRAKWLESWPEAAGFFEHTRTRKPQMHTARRGVLVCSGAGCPICETPITLSGRLVSSAPNVQNIPKPKFDVAYAELEMRLFAELQGAKEKA